MQVNVKSLNLSEKALEKLARLAGNRLSDNKLTVITDRCHTRAQNIEYAHYLLTVLFHEAQKSEKWDDLAGRADSLKVKFDGSSTKTKLIELIEKSGASGDKNDKKLEDFEKMWEDYRNSEETADKTREYAKQMKKLLGIDK